MMNFIKKYVSLLKQDFLLFALLSLPGLLFYFIGLHQLEAFTVTTATLGALNKFICEFLTISIIFCFFHMLGFKKRWVFALIMFLYYITVTADIVLLVYFKERFGAKYLPTLGGAQYRFLLDIRLLLYFAAIFILPYFAIKKGWHRSSRHQSAKKIAVSAVLLVALGFISPLKYINGSAAFFAYDLMDTTAINIVKDCYVKKYPYAYYDTSLEKLPKDLQNAAERYNLFTDTKFVNQNTYDRIILITTEAFSNKFIKTVNPAIPASASYIYDGLMKSFPSVSLKPVTLSTLYGLSVVFSGHPNAELIFKNKFPISFVSILKDKGFKTVFIRGANEEYMQENVLFKEAGFEEIYGAKHFAALPEYKKYVSWWGLTDRKLFEFTTDYLKDLLKTNPSQKVFINLLTVDSHVPTGRIDYLGQEYSPVEGDDVSKSVKKLYTRPNMPRAFSHYNYDLGVFLENLSKENVFDDKTMVILTADHPFFANIDTGSLFKDYKPSFDEVPLILISKKYAKETAYSNPFASQQDIAPTVLALAGYAAPKGMFGRSIFENTDRTVFNIKNNYVIVKNAKGSRLIPFNSKHPQDIETLKLLNTVFK